MTCGCPCGCSNGSLASLARSPTYLTLSFSSNTVPLASAFKNSFKQSRVPSLISSIFVSSPGISRGTMPSNADDQFSVYTLWVFSQLAMSAATFFPLSPSSCDKILNP